MFGLLSALAVTASLSAAPPSSAPAPTSAAQQRRQEPPLPPSPSGAELAWATKLLIMSSGLVGDHQFVPLVIPPPSAAPAVASGSGASAGTANTSQAPSAAGAPSGPSAGAAVSPPPSMTATAAAPVPPGSVATSGAGGPGIATPASGATGDCNITVTDLTSPLTVQCTTGTSGSVAGTGHGGDSGAVTGVVGPGSGVGGSAPGAVAGPSTGAGTGTASLAGGTPGAASSVATTGTQGSCLLSTTNTAAALSVSCAPGAVGPAGGAAAGGSPGPTDAAGGPPPPAAADDPNSTAPEAAGSGRGGDASTTVSSGRTGNCIIHLVNIRAALNVICITGGSGDAAGTSDGGRSGSATLLEAGPGGGATADGVGRAASSGAGGNAMAVVSSGGTGSCIIFFVNVMASVSVLCITGDSGAASGSATGGTSGSAVLLMSSGAAQGSPDQARENVRSGSGGRASAVVTSGGTGDCAISFTNVWGSISLLCRTGRSGPAWGQAVGGDSGSAVVMLKAPGQPLALPAAAMSPFGTGLNNLLSAGPPAAQPQTGTNEFLSVGFPEVVADPADRAAVVQLPSSTQGAAHTAASGGTSLPPAIAPQASFLPLSGLGTSVPLSMAAGLILTGGAVATVAGRRRRVGARSRGN